MLKREGPTLATYGLAERPARLSAAARIPVAKLKRDAGITCTADEILVTSGSLQAIDLVNGVFLARGDTVIIEQETLWRLAQRGSRGSASSTVGIPLDDGGMRMDALATALDDLKRRGVRAEIHLHDPDGAEPDRHDHAARRAAPNCWSCPRRTACRSSRTTAMPT